MQLALKAIAWIVGALLVVLLAAFVWGRLRPPTATQAEALALLRPASASPGRNAWPVLWLMDYDVPADRIDAVYAQERMHMQDWANHLPATPSTTDVIYKPLVAAQYSKRAAIDTADRQRLCASKEEDCLAKVRAGGQPLRDLLARQAGRLAQVESMNTADMLWDDVPANRFSFEQLPAFINTEDLLLTAAAMDFADGRQAQALSAVCRQAASVRRLHARTNSLIAAMVGIMWMEADERVLAGMLKELPSDQAVPDECMQAFAPPVLADVSLCLPMQHEYEAVAGIMGTLAPDRLHGFQRLKMAALLDERGFRRLRAPTFAWACQQRVQIAALADQQLPMMDMLAVRYDAFDAVSNTVGLILARVGTPGYAQYVARNQDYAAGLRMMAWLLHTRAMATDWQQQLAKALPTLRESGNRSISIDPDGRFLHMRYYATRPDSGRRRQIAISNASIASSRARLDFIDHPMTARE